MGPTNSLVPGLWLTEPSPGRRLAKTDNTSDSSGNARSLCGSEKHDEHTVARLTFESDPVFNALVCGKDAIAVIQGMLPLGGGCKEEM